MLPCELFIDPLSRPAQPGSRPGTSISRLPTRRSDPARTPTAGRRGAAVHRRRSIARERVRLALGLSLFSPWLFLRGLSWAIAMIGYGGLAERASPQRRGRSSTGMARGGGGSRAHGGNRYAQSGSRGPQGAGFQGYGGWGAWRPTRSAKRFDELAGSLGLGGGGRSARGIVRSGQPPASRTKARIASMVAQGEGRMRLYGSRHSHRCLCLVRSTSQERSPSLPLEHSTGPGRRRYGPARAGGIGHGEPAQLGVPRTASQSGQ